MTGKGRKRRVRRCPARCTESSVEVHPLELTEEEKKDLVLGALMSTLLLGLIYVAGAGILIWLMLRLWS